MFCYFVSVTMTLTSELRLQLTCSNVCNAKEGQALLLQVA